MFANDQFYFEDLQNAGNVELPKKDFSILVTGATGLIGSFLVDTLLYLQKQDRCNVKITAMSRSLERLEKCFGRIGENASLRFLVQNVTEKISDDNSYDYIIHLASNADPRSYALYPVETITTNVLGTKNVLEYQRRKPKCKALIASTFEFYGEMKEIEKITEDSCGMIDANAIRSGYPESKRVSELLAKSYVEEYHVNVVIARLSSIYGPTMAQGDNKAAAQFIRKAVKSEDIILKSQGTQRRSYTYVADCAAGILTALFRGKSGEAYNVCNPNSEVTISELASTAAEIAGSHVIFDLPDELEKKGFGKSKDSVLDGQKLMKLGFLPQYTVKDGMFRTIQILRDINSDCSLSRWIEKL